MKRWFLYAVMTVTLFIIVVFVGLLPMLKWYFPLEYDDVVTRHAEKYDLDPLLIIAMMRIESEFDPLAVSPKGARGLMQIMPETGAWVAEQMGLAPFQIDGLFDPETNVAIGVWYLASLKKQFGGDEVLALAAYNGGRGNVARWLGQNVWSGAWEDVQDIPFPETRGYIRKVLMMYDWYQKVWHPDSWLNAGHWLKAVDGYIPRSSTRS